MAGTVAAALAATFVLYGGWVFVREVLTRLLEREPQAEPRPLATRFPVSE